MRRILLALSITLALSSCSTSGSNGQSTQEQSDSTAIAQRVYDIYEQVFGYYDHSQGSPSISGKTDSMYCSHNWNLWLNRVHTADAKIEDGTIGFFDADYWIMGQDWQDLSVSDVHVVTMTDSTAMTELKLHNCGSVTDVRLEMVQENGEWKIDNFIDATHGLDWKTSMQEYLKN